MRGKGAVTVARRERLHARRHRVRHRCLGREAELLAPVLGDVPHRHLRHGGSPRLPAQSRGSAVPVARRTGRPPLRRAPSPPVDAFRRTVDAWLTIADAQDRRKNVFFSVCRRRRLVRFLVLFSLSSVSLSQLSSAAQLPLSLSLSVSAETVTDPLSLSLSLSLLARSLSSRERTRPRADPTGRPQSRQCSMAATDSMAAAAAWLRRWSHPTPAFLVRLGRVQLVRAERARARERDRDR